MARVDFSKSNPVGVEAGQVYRSKAEYGYRYVKIQSVRKKTAAKLPHVFAVEVSKAGKKVYRPRDGIGSVVFKIWLTWNLDKRHWAMPAHYEIDED